MLIRIQKVGPWNYYKRYWCHWGIRLFGQGGSCTLVIFCPVPRTGDNPRQLCSLLQVLFSRGMPEGKWLTIVALLLSGAPRRF